MYIHKKFMAHSLGIAIITSLAIMLLAGGTAVGTHMILNCVFLLISNGISIPPTGSRWIAWECICC